MTSNKTVLNFTGKWRLRNKKVATLFKQEEGVVQWRGVVEDNGHHTSHFWDKNGCSLTDPTYDLWEKVRDCENTYM